MNSNLKPPPYTRFEIILRIITILLLFIVALIGYITLIYNKDLKVFKVIVGAYLIYWGLKGKKSQALFLNKWVLRIGGAILILSSIFI